MPLGLAAATLIGTGASAVGSAIQSWRQRRMQKKMAQETYQKDLDMWNRQNAYNSPQAQMERLKEAGLNPNLVYGQGAAGATGQATTMPKHQRWETPVAQMPNVLGMIGQYQAIRGQKLSNEGKAIANQFIEATALEKMDNIAASTKNLTLKNLLNSWLMGDPMSKQASTSPYMRQYMAQVRSSEDLATLRRFDKEFYDTIPKEYQWIANLIRQLIR